MPDITLTGLRELWKRHRNPKLLFLNGNGSKETIKNAVKHMDKGGVQQAMKQVVTE